MVDRIFEVIKDNSSSTGFLIKETVTDNVLELPSICIEEFDLGTKHVRFCDTYKKMSPVRIALAGGYFKRDEAIVYNQRKSRASY